MPGNPRGLSDRAAFLFFCYTFKNDMNPNDESQKLDSDGTGGLDLEGIIIETTTPADATSLSGGTGGEPQGTHVADDLLEESGIEILKNGRSIDLNDPDLI